MGKRTVRLADPFFQETYLTHGFARPEHEPWAPPMDLAETDGEVIIRMEIAGVQEGDIRVCLVGKTLKVEGTKQEPSFRPDERVRYLCVERGYGAFRKALELRWVIDPARVTAQVDNGVLTIVLPKLPDRRGTVFEVPVRFQTEE